MTDSEILKYSKQCQPASHTVKPRKFKLRFLKYSLIRNKFRTQWMQRKGPNRGVSHYRILPVSRDIGWPVQQLDYFRYIKQHILTIELLYIGYNFKEIKNGN